MCFKPAAHGCVAGCLGVLPPLQLRGCAVGHFPLCGSVWADSRLVINITFPASIPIYNQSLVYSPPDSSCLLGRPLACIFHRGVKWRPRWRRRGGAMQLQPCSTCEAAWLVFPPKFSYSTLIYAWVGTFTENPGPRSHLPPRVWQRRSALAPAPAPFRRI